MVDFANTVFRDFVTDGVPASGTNKPVKSKIRQWGTWLESIITAFTSNGGLIYSSLAAMNADLLHGANSSAWVLGDATVANNGIYKKIGASGTGSWTRVADLPYSYIQATDAGAGTPNAIVATSSIPLPAADAGALIAFSVFEANTASPVTVAFNGGAALTIKTSSGNNVVAGGLTAGMVVAGYKSGTTFRLLSDQASAAIQAAAEAAQAAAEAAQDAAEAAAADAAASAAAASGAVPVADRTALKALNVSTKKAAIIYDEGGRNGEFVFTSGNLSALVTADASEGIYIAPASDPTGASGAWVRLAGWHADGKVAGEWFGVLGDYLTNATDDSAALQAGASMAATLGVRGVKLGSGTYGVGSQIVLPRNVGIYGPGYSIGTRWDSANAVWVHGQGANFAITHAPAVKTEANSTFLLTTGSGLKGVCFWYPNQPVVNIVTLVQYAPTVGMTADAQGYMGTVAGAFVEDCYATNPYTFLSWTGRHGVCNIKNVVGTCLKAGFIIDQSYDIDRLLDIHFNPNSAYISDWASNGVLQAQYANNAVFMELAKADQAYLDRVFSYGCKTGLLMSDRGNGAAGGAAFGTCGFEGCDLPLSITGAPQEVDFGYTQFGTSTSITTGNHAILIAPVGNPSNLNFSRCRSFRSVGSAIQAANVKGLNLNGFRAGNAVDKGDFPRGVVSLNACSEVQASGMNLDITSSGQVVPVVMTNCSNFRLDDNFFGGTATTWGSFTSCSNGEARNNRAKAGASIPATPFITGAGTTNVVIDPLATTPNGDAMLSIRASDLALADVATVQNLFASANDEFTVDASTTYDVEAEYMISRAAGTTSHTLAVLFGGTATLTSIDLVSEVANPTGNVLSGPQFLHITAATATTLTAANTSATEYIIVKLRGSIRVNATGTIIPQLQYSAAPGGAPTIKRGSYFRMKPIGPGSMTTQGRVS